jgi:hypothetical protein
MGMLLGVAHTHLHLLLASNVGFLNCWGPVLSHWDTAWLFSLVQLRSKKWKTSKLLYR